MAVLIFIIGTIFGSFYNVVGYRIPKKESIVFPPSHCTKCNHKLRFYELIPIVSYIFQKGKCTKCNEKISIFYPIFEFITGLLFLFSYLSYGMNLNLIIVLTFVSMLIIVTVSDYIYMIISDSILLFFSFLLIVEIGLINGPRAIILSIISGIESFSFMFILKKIGDFIFKKESMGGGDIKLLFTFGLVLHFPISILSIFTGSLIGLPVALFLLNKNSSHIIPFGPFLSVGATILLLFQVNMDKFITFFNFINLN